MNIKSFLLGACFFFPMLANAANDLKKQDAFLHELESAKYLLGLKYCPTNWKAEYLDWDVEAAFENAKSQLIEYGKLSTKDYQGVFRGFLGSLQDYHISTLFYSTEWSAFPIVVKRAHGRYFITDFNFQISMRFLDYGFAFSEIDSDRVESELAKCSIGDELLEINGIPIKAVIENLIDRELAGDRTPTGYALAERMLFTRYGNRGHDVPKGDFTITVKDLKSSKKQTLLLSWLHVDEWVNDPIPKKTVPDSSNRWRRLEQYFTKDYGVSLAKDLLKSPLSQIVPSEDKDDLREKSFVPPLGKILWETRADSDFYAYIYENEQNQKIGYLHIPDFDASGWYAEDYMEQWISIIKKFESETAALVLDLNDNPGGNLFYMYGILSLLSDRPMKTPLQMESLVQEDVYNMAVIYNEIISDLEDSNDQDSGEDSNDQDSGEDSNDQDSGEDSNDQDSGEDSNDQDSGEDSNDQDSSLGTISGYPIDKQALIKTADYAKSIIDQWDAGSTRTEPAHVYGIDFLMPHPEAHYTKPILLLINELDFSCGDLFPAILQDNDRATLFGRKTAGAGGYVRPYYQTSQFGIKLYSLTGSLAYRLNGEVIENLGVTPDVAYEISESDLRFGFSDYVKAVNRSVYQLTK